MKIPNKIDIGGQEISVELGDIAYANALGLFSSDDQTIVLANDQKECVVASTLVHEILEAINAIYNLEMNHNQIQIASQALFQVLRTNDLDFRKTATQNTKSRRGSKQ